MEITDEKLLKKAGHAAKTLRAMCVLAVLGAIVFVLLIQVFGARIAIPAAVGMLLICASFAILSVAAGRGNLRAVEIAILFLALHLAYNFILFISNQQNQGKAFPPGFLVVLLMIVALASNWRTLNKLKERNLWQTAFASAKPSKTLCIAGGVLTVLGYFLVNGSLAVGVAGVKRDVEAAKKRIDQCTLTLNQKVPALMDALKEFVGKNDQECYAKVLAKADELVKAIDTLREETKDIEDMQVVLRSYAAAAAKWKAGIDLLRADPNRANEFFKQGDISHQQAINDFEKFFRPKIGTK